MKKVLYTLFLLAFVVCITNSCRKSHTEVDSVLTNSGNINSGSLVSTSINGIVLDESNKPVSGASISAYGHSATSNAQGIFFFDKINVDNKRCIVQFYKGGFFNRSHAFIPKENNVNYLKIVLMSKPAVQTFQSATGATITTPGGASVQFAANSISKADGSAYTGIVNVVAKQLATDDANFGYMIPGGDLAGTDVGNKNAVLISYGMLSVELTDNSGASLQLSKNTTATLTVPIAAGQLSSASSAISLWYFDDATSLWKEQGEATKTGNNYVGPVSHFTWWNCDRGKGKTSIKGKVFDVNGHPLPNLTVSVNETMTIMTDGDGNYSSWCPANTALTFEVKEQYNTLGLVSQLENVAPLAVDQVYTVPNLICGNDPSITGVLNDCNNKPVNGCVSVTDQQGNLLNYAYSTDGTFNFVVPHSTPLSIIGVSASGINGSPFTSPAVNDSLNIGVIRLCDHRIPAKGTFHIAIYNLDTTVQIDPITSSAKDTLNGFLLIKLRSFFGSLSTLSICINPASGNYTINPGSFSAGYSAAFSFEYYAYNYSSANAGSQFNVTVINQGGTIKGTFNGIIAPLGTPYPNPVQITGGDFEVARY